MESKPVGKKTLFLAGTFDDSGGKPSKIAQAIYDGLGDRKIEYINGGKFEDIRKYVDNARQYNTVYWFANVPNDKPKLIFDLKKNNPAMILVSSKRNRRGDDYAFKDLLGRALKNKSNLLLEFTENENNVLHGRVLDPLGNVYLDHHPDFKNVGKVLAQRVKQLKGFTRVNSRSVGEAISVPKHGEFFKIVRKHADTFHDIIHTSFDSSGRFLGNASFRADEDSTRCMKGFPSMRAKDGLIFVSRRNVDKRDIGPESFVAVHPEKLPVHFYGEHKPSVDTPIQVRLYQHYPNVNFILHSHTYIKGAPFTSEPIPCGALEEVDAIRKVMPKKSATNFAVNLLGHGSIVLSENPSFLKDLDFYARPFPEVHEKYHQCTTSQKRK